MNNYTEETQPLFKLLRTPAFRFVVVRFNHYSLVRRLQSDLLEQFPDRKVSTINTEKATYEEILKTFLEQKEGFFFLENFEDILKRDADSLGKTTPEMEQNNQRRSSIAAGLNMRRDKLAKSPIAIIAFVFATSGELYVRSLMEKMPDLWSFRSLLLDLKFVQEEQEVSITDFIQMQPTLDPMSGSTIGGSRQEDKLTELDRLLAQVKETPATEINYLKNLYEQIAELQKETGQYDDAIKTIDYLCVNTDDLEKKFWLLIDKGDLFDNTGQLEKAQEAYVNAHKTAILSVNKLLEGVSLQRLGNISFSRRDLSTTISHYEEATSIFKELHKSNLNNENFKIGLAISYSKLGDTHTLLGDLNKALQYYEKDMLISKELYEADKNDMDFKNGLAISYSKIGKIHSLKGSLNKALFSYIEFNQLMKELIRVYPENIKIRNYNVISIEKLGDTYLKLGDYEKAQHLFTEEICLFEELNNEYPQNVSLQNGLAISYSKMGYLFRDKLNDFQTSKTYFLKAEKILSVLVLTSPNHAEFKKNLEQVQKELASLSD